MIRIVLVTAVTLAFSAGCGGEGQPPEAEAEVTEEIQSEVTELNNEMCPVMGNPVAGGQYFDWEGYRIGICCPGCEASFKADPGSFIPALLQDPGVSEELKAELSSYLENQETSQ